jgi:hypothetical protein
MDESQTVTILAKPEPAKRQEPARTLETAAAVGAGASNSLVHPRDIIKLDDDDFGKF